LIDEENTATYWRISNLFWNPTIELDAESKLFTESPLAETTRMEKN